MKYDDHTPSPLELDKEARDRLKNLFSKSLEMESAAMIAGEQVAGQATHRIVFEGQADGEGEVMNRGEVVFFGDQGIGYWLFAWSPKPSAESLMGEFKELRTSLKLLGEREEWKQIQQRPGRAIKGESVEGYQLTDALSRWEKQESPKDYDPKADIVLRAPDPIQPKQKTLAVDLLIMSLPKSDKDPVEAARAHIKAKLERDGSPNAKINDADGEGAKDRVGSVKGHLLRWRISGDGIDRFALVGVVPRANDVLVLFADTPWDRRANWEAQLQQLYGSLQLR